MNTINVTYADRKATIDNDYAGTQDDNLATQMTFTIPAELMQYSMRIDWDVFVEINGHSVKPSTYVENNTYFIENFILAYTNNGILRFQLTFVNTAGEEIESSNIVTLKVARGVKKSPVSPSDPDYIQFNKLKQLAHISVGWVGLRLTFNTLEGEPQSVTIPWSKISGSVQDNAELWGYLNQIATLLPYDPNEMTDSQYVYWKDGKAITKNIKLEEIGGLLAFLNNIIDLINNESDARITGDNLNASAISTETQERRNEDQLRLLRNDEFSADAKAGTSAYKDAGMTAGMVALIGDNGLLPTSIIPPSAFEDVWVTDNVANLTSLTDTDGTHPHPHPTHGDIAFVDSGDPPVPGAGDGSYMLTKDPYTDASNWKKYSDATIVSEISGTGAFVKSVTASGQTVYVQLGGAGISDIEGLSDALAGKATPADIATAINALSSVYIPITQKGANGGVATLDSIGRVENKQGIVTSHPSYVYPSGYMLSNSSTFIRCTNQNAGLPFDEPDLPTQEIGTIHVRGNGTGNVAEIALSFKSNRMAIRHGNADNTWTGWVIIDKAIPATSNVLGSIQADPATEEDVQAVHIGTDNKLYVPSTIGTAIIVRMWD